MVGAKPISGVEDVEDTAIMLQKDIARHAGTVGPGE